MYIITANVNNVDKQMGCVSTLLRILYNVSMCTAAVLCSVLCKSHLVGFMVIFTCEMDS